MAIVKSLQIDRVEKLLDALTDTGDNAGATFAVSSASFRPAGRLVTWQSIPDGVPGAISLQLQGSLDNTVWAVLDSSTNVSGEMRHVGPVNIKFLRARQVSRTEATSITVQAKVA